MIKLVKQNRNERRLFSLILAFSMICASSLFAQTQTISGTVTDTYGETVIGASVLVKGTNNGTITDVAGNYTVSNLRENDVLVFSFIGYVTQEVRYTGQRTLNVIMNENVEVLDEVVVIGYGTLSRREISSSIVQVNRENFVQGATSNPMEMLQGKVAGLTVHNTQPGNPNANETRLQIRGAASLTASNDPLVIIDGILGASLNSISNQDIESITVLKDAASAAIYGTRGANGVILVTTKRGLEREGQTRVTYDSWIGLDAFKAGPRVLTPEEFRAKDRDADFGASTNWRDLIMRDGPSYDVNQYVSLDGNMRNGSYGASVNYRKSTGADWVTDREEVGSRLNFQQRALNNLLELNTSLTYRKTTSNSGNAGWGSALTTNPTMPVYNDDGSFYQPTSPTGATQPYAQLSLLDDKSNIMRIMAFWEAKAHILKQANQSLNVSLSYSIDHNATDRYEYWPSTSSDSYWNGYTGRASRSSNKNWRNRAELVGNYFLNFNGHDFKVVVGYNYDEYNEERFSAGNTNFTFDQFLWNDLGSGTYLRDGRASMSTSKTKTKLIGVFGRISYNWQNLLFATASYRHEGSTKFGRDSKWGDFYAGSLAFEVANLSFMKDYPSVNSLKPRISYGVTGRSDFDPYLSLQTYGSSSTSSNNSRQYYMDGRWYVGFRPSVNANSFLAWEKAIVTNAGIDLSLFRRLRVSFEWFERQSKDLLYRYTAPQPPFLYDNIMVNVGTIRNRGVEFTIDGDILTKTPLKWTSGIVAGNGVTHLTKLSDDVFQASWLNLGSTGGTGSQDYHFRVMEGGMIGEYWILEWTGNIDDNGNMYVYNADGNEILMGAARSTDKRHLGKTGVPKLDLSWNNTFRYKNFDLNMFWRGAFGFYLYNGLKSGMGLVGGGQSNLLLSAYDTKLKYAGGITSSYFLEKGDYWKLDNVALGYNFRPKANNYLENLRVYVSARNIATFTGYTGNDPSFIRVTGLTPGTGDGGGTYPQAVTYTIGLTLRLK